MSSNESDSDKEMIKKKSQKKAKDDKMKHKRVIGDGNSSADSDRELPAEERNPKKAAGSAKKQKVDEDEHADGKFLLGSKRFVSVNEWKGRKQIDIREFYLADDGELKPGKKGISLSVDQFKQLVEFIPKIKAKLDD